MSLSVTENKQGSLVHHFTQLPKHEDFANDEHVTEMGSLVELNVDSMSMKREIFGAVIFSSLQITSIGLWAFCDEGNK